MFNKINLIIFQKRKKKQYHFSKNILIFDTLDIYLMYLMSNLLIDIKFIDVSAK